MRAILRRLDPMRCVGQTFNFGPLTVNTEKMKLINGSDEYELTPRHAKMLVLFAGNPNRVISRQELYRKVWNESMDGIETRTVDMHIVRLRELLTEAGTKTDLIQTVRGAGYKYEYKA
jgi:DNA-binding response OmpR family regulator